MSQNLGTGIDMDTDVGTLQYNWDMNLLHKKSKINVRVMEVIASLLILNKHFTFIHRKLQIYLWWWLKEIW